MSETDINLLAQEFHNYKEVTNKEIQELREMTKNQELRIIELEKSQSVTDLRFEQIIEILNKLNNETIPNLTKEIEELKNKPIKRYDTVVTGMISAIIGGIVGFIVNKFLGGGN